jgi:hypothetical protein
MDDLYQYIFYFYTHIIQYSPIENLDELVRDYNLSLKKLKEEFQRISYLFQIIPNDQTKEDVIILDRTIEIQYKQLEKGLKLVKYEKWSYQTKTLRNAQIKNVKKIIVGFSADIIFNILQTTLKKKYNINTPNYHEIKFRLIPEFLEKQLLYDLFTGLAQKYDIMASKIKEIVIRKEGILKPSSISNDYFEFSDHRLHYIIKDLKEIAVKKREIQQLKDFIVQDEVSLLNEKPTLGRYNKSLVNNTILGLSDYDIRELKKIIVKLESDIVTQIQLLKKRHKSLFEEYSFIGKFLEYLETEKSKCC